MPACTTTQLLPAQLVEIIARTVASQRHLEHRGGMTEAEAKALLRVLYEDEHMACVVKVKEERSGLSCICCEVRVSLESMCYTFIQDSNTVYDNMQGPRPVSGGPTPPQLVGVGSGSRI